MYSSLFRLRLVVENLSRWLKMDVIFGMKDQIVSSTLDLVRDGLEKK